MHRAMIPNESTQLDRAGERVSSRRSRAARAVLLSLLCVASWHATAASEPEIVRLRVPAKTTSRWFPPGTELRVLTAEAFESLLERANQAEQRRLSAGAPRLVRARHRARWEGGVLRGETDLIIVKSAAGPADYVLDVWSPAVISATRSGSANYSRRRASRPIVRGAGAAGRFAAIDHG